MTDQSDRETRFSLSNLPNQAARDEWRSWLIVLDELIVEGADHEALADHLYHRPDRWAQRLPSESPARGAH